MDHVKRLRKDQTDAECALWLRLRNGQLGAKFRRQHRACGYILDFACVEHLVAIELDGGQHIENAESDAVRTASLQSAGWRVLRFWNDDALVKTDAVLEQIWRAIQSKPPHPNPLPRRRGRGSRSNANSSSDSSDVNSSDVNSSNVNSSNVNSSNVNSSNVNSSNVNSNNVNSNIDALTPSPPPAGERVGVRGAFDFRPSASIAALRLRAKLYALVRQFFAARNVLEVETPMLSQAGNTDPNIESFRTHFSGHVDAGTADRWLRTSPEFPLKRLLAAGIGDCYELGRVFRNGEAGRRHNPEFTLLEWYRVGWDHRRLMDETAELVGLALAMVGRSVWVRKVTYRELFFEAVGIDPLTCEEAALRASLGNIEIDPTGLGRDDWLDLVLTHRIQPTFARDELLIVHDFPASQCALAKIRADDPPVAERFELYLGPVELANGYHELTDAHEQKQRFLRDQLMRDQRGDCVPPIDERLLAALVHGLPDCAGVALGIDRLLAILLEIDTLAETLTFAFDRA